jgi:hypothetical protein
MFAPRFAKAAASPTTGGLSSCRSTLGARPFGVDPTEQAEKLQRSNGSHAAPRSLAQGARSLAGNEHADRQEREANRAAGNAPRSSWDFSRISVSRPDQSNRAQSGLPYAAASGQQADSLTATASRASVTPSIARTVRDGPCSCGTGGRKQSSQGLSTAGAPSMTGEPNGPGPVDAGGTPAAGEGDSGNLPGAPSACLVASALTYARSGIIRSPAGFVGESFEVRAQWSSPPVNVRGQTSYCAAECGEYHQFIKGHMRSSSNQDGSNSTDVGAKVFGGLALDENQFREDGLDDNPKARYGHRKERQTMNEQYEPDRLTGTKYVGKDFPRVMIGAFADIDVTFLGKLVDICNNTDSSSATWRVQYRGVIRP